MSLSKETLIATPQLELSMPFQHINNALSHHGH